MSRDKFRLGSIAMLLGIILAFGADANAGSTSITYQGVLRDGTGEPVADGAYDISVALFTAPTGGTPVWQESHPATPVVAGAFSLDLGNGTAFGNLFEAEPNLFLELTADTGAGPVTYDPRVPLSASPYAHEAAHAQTADTATFADAAAMATSATNATNATNAVTATNAVHATTADDADTVDGVDAADLEESAEIDADIAAHDADANAHANMLLDAAQIATGTLDNARLNMGSGNGLDADTVDGVEAAALEESAEIDADIAAHDADANAHANMTIDGAQIDSGTISNARLNTGSGNGLDADTVDGAHAASLEESAEIDADIAAHNADGAAHADIRAMAVPLGTIIPVYIGLAGVPTVESLQSLGWALCDGTTPASQDIDNAVITVATPDLNNTGRFIRGGNTAGTPQADNVGTHNHGASFSGGATSTAGAHTHTVTGNTDVQGNHDHQERGVHINDALGLTGITQGGGPQNAFSGYVHGSNSRTDFNGAHSHNVSGTAASAGGHSHTVTGTVTVNNNAPGGETRPVNMSMVYFIKVR